MDWFYRLIRVDRVVPFLFLTHHLRDGLVYLFCFFSDLHLVGGLVISLVLVPVRLSITDLFCIPFAFRPLLFENHCEIPSPHRYQSFPSIHCHFASLLQYFLPNGGCRAESACVFSAFAISATKSFFCGLKRFVNRSYLDRRPARGSTRFAVSWNPVGYWTRATIQTPPRVSAFSYLRGLFYGPVQLELSVCDREDASKS